VEKQPYKVLRVLKVIIAFYKVWYEKRFIDFWNLLSLVLNIFIKQATRTKSTSSYYWRYGTTGSFGGESVVSDYDYYGKESYASVKNAMGVMVNGGWKRTGQSKAALPVYTFKTDYSYYIFR